MANQSVSANIVADSGMYPGTFLAQASLQAGAHVYAPTFLAAAHIAGSATMTAVPTAQYQLGAYGADPFGTSPYGSVLAPFGVVSAASLSPYTVEVNFNAILDFTYGPMLDPANYTIPGLTVSGVIPQSAGSVVLLTSPQTDILYTVSVALARGIFGQALDVNLRSASFEGQVVSPTMKAVGISPVKIRILFDVAMLADSNLSNPSSYAVSGMHGNALTVDSVIVEQTTNVVSVALVLNGSTKLLTQNSYEVTISSSVHSVDGGNISPATVVFYWVDEWVQPIDRPNKPDGLPLVIPLKVFTGEVRGGLLGNPDGQVFFSPALDAPTSGSVIQVDEVDVCTYAYDSYHIPQPIDPNPLYTYSTAAQPPGNYLGPFGAVLWAPFPRNFEAQIILTAGTVYPIVPFADDPMPVADDTGCVVSMKQEWDPNYVALLNNPAWRIFKRNSVIDGSSSISAAAKAHYQAHSSIVGNSSASGRPFEHQHGRASIVADSQVFVGAHGASNVVADSKLKAVGGVPQKAHASIVAASFVEAEENQPFPTSPMVFICANNLLPLPTPSATHILVLKEQLIGGSSFAAA